LNYAIHKSDYLSLSDKQIANISMSELNDHYFDATEQHNLHVEGTLSISLDADKLAEANLTDEDIGKLIDTADYQVEVEEVEAAPNSD